VSIDRYHRQTLLPQIGIEGQKKLRESSVVLIGCGALGTVISDQLVRAGIGRIRIVDRDIVELTNLQRQVLFTESDARDEIPKAIAAVKRLQAVNSEIEIEPLVADVHAGNIEEIIRGADVLLDGTDNAQARYLLNDAAVKHSMAWVYGACVGIEGRVMLIRPGVTPCLRCIFPEPPSAGELPTCDTVGVLASAANIVASLQVVAAIKFLTGGATDESSLVTLDAWTPQLRHLRLTDPPRDDCLTCGQKQFAFLDRPASYFVSLCGRDAVQVQPASRFENANHDAMEDRLRSAGEVQRTPYFLRCTLRDSAPLRLTIFPDGRTIVHGTNDPKRARAIYDRYVGS
jgi:adenylyltransferase/sulfurtransferase